MNNANASIGFGIGILTGMVILAALMHFTDSSPVQIIRKYQQEAVRLGYATYVVDTNEYKGETPRIKFEWVKENP